MDELQRLERRYCRIKGMVGEIMAKAKLIKNRLKDQPSEEEARVMLQKVKKFQREVNKYERMLVEIKEKVKGIIDGIT